MDSNLDDMKLGEERFLPITLSFWDLFWIFFGIPFGIWVKKSETETGFHMQFRLDWWEKTWDTTLTK